MFDTLFAKLQAYLPPWIKSTDAMLSILKAEANAILSVYQYAQTITTIFTTKQSLRLTAGDWGQWLAGTESDATIVANMKNRFTILSARGTETGILSDVQAISGDVTASVVTDPARGWVVGVTYPGDNYVYVGLDRVHILAVTFANKSLRSTTEIKSIIRRYMAPLNAFLFFN